MAAFDALIEAQLSGKTVRVAPLVRFDFRSGPMAVWPGTSPRVFGGETYRPLPGLSVSALSADAGLVASEMEIQLFATPEMLAHLSEDAAESAGRQVRVGVQFFEMRQRDEAGNWVDWQPVDEPLVLFVGRMGPLEVDRPASDGEATRVLSVKAQDAFVNAARPPFGTYSHQDQQMRAPGDNLFARQNRMASKKVLWPDYS